MPPKLKYNNAKERVSLLKSLLKRKEAGSPTAEKSTDCDQLLRLLNILPRTDGIIDPRAEQAVTNYIYSPKITIFTTAIRTFNGIANDEVKNKAYEIINRILATPAAQLCKRHESEEAGSYQWGLDLDTINDFAYSKAFSGESDSALASDLIHYFIQLRIAVAIQELKLPYPILKLEEPNPESMDSLARLMSYVHTVYELLNGIMTSQLDQQTKMAVFAQTVSQLQFDIRRAIGHKAEYGANIVKYFGMNAMKGTTSKKPHRSIDGIWSGYHGKLIRILKAAFKKELPDFPVVAIDSDSDLRELKSHRILTRVLEYVNREAASFSFVRTAVLNILTLRFMYASTGQPIDEMFDVTSGYGGRFLAHLVIQKYLQQRAKHSVKPQYLLPLKSLRINDLNAKCIESYKGVLKYVTAYFKSKEPFERLELSQEDSSTYKVDAKSLGNTCPPYIYHANKSKDEQSTEIAAMRKQKYKLLEQYGRDAGSTGWDVESTWWYTNFLGAILKKGQGGAIIISTEMYKDLERLSLWPSDVHVHMVIPAKGALEKSNEVAVFYTKNLAVHKEHGAGTVEVDAPINKLPAFSGLRETDGKSVYECVVNGNKKALEKYVQRHIEHVTSSTATGKSAMTTEDADKVAASECPDTVKQAVAMDYEVASPASPQIPLQLDMDDVPLEDELVFQAPYTSTDVPKNNSGSKRSYSKVDFDTDKESHALLDLLATAAEARSLEHRSRPVV